MSPGLVTSLPGASSADWEKKPPSESWPEGAERCGMCVCAVSAWEVGPFPLPAPSSCPEEASQPHVGREVTLALSFQAQSHVDGGVGAQVGLRRARSLWAGGVSLEVLGGTVGGRLASPPHAEALGSVVVCQGARRVWFLLQPSGEAPGTSGGSSVSHGLHLQCRDLFSLGLWWEMTARDAGLAWLGSNHESRLRPRNGPRPGLLQAAGECSL